MSEPETIRFPVRGMTCSSCVNRITRAVRRLDGVTKVQVDLGHETATVRRDPAILPDTTLAAAIVQAGYEPDLGAATAVPDVPGIERRSILDRVFRR